MTQPITVLTTPGPARAAAITAGAARLKMRVGVCGDRARAAAAAVLDAGVAAAIASSDVGKPEHPRQPEQT